MYLLDEQLVLSASDLNNYLVCRHLTTLDLRYAGGDRTITPGQSPDAELLFRKGDEHEAAYLQSLKDKGRQVVEFPLPGRDPESLGEAATATEQAMHDGAEVIYQGTFFQDNLRGHADFLFRVDRPSDLGAWSYEVGDTKLARRTKPHFILQLCFYSELLAAVQGGDPPELIHVILGTREEHQFRLAEFSAYFRHVRDRFLAELAADSWDTYPLPIQHCSVCRWSDDCDARWVADDHLSLVARLSRAQTEKLEVVGIKTVANLASQGPGLTVPKIGAETLERLREQAALQVKGRENGKGIYKVLAPEEKRGFARLPKPSDGDVFFDMEGDPWFDEGLEYLFGIVTVDEGEPHFEAIWGHDRAEEGRALEQFIDYVTERRAKYPDLHIYHYAGYEITALKRLAGMHGTSEEELDQLLRDEVFVDLLKVVTEGVRISEPRYGLKNVETFFMDERQTVVTDGNQSVAWFEEWLETGEQKLLDEIADYNEDDCESTWLLREWLLKLREEAGSEYGAEIDWFEHEPSEQTEDKVALREENEKLIRGLLEGIPDDTEPNDEQQARRLMAQLLEYHHREARPVWWMFFDHCQAEADELFYDADCISDLEADETVEPRPEKQSLLYRLKFPPQETKLGPPRQVKDPASRADTGSIHEIDREHGWLDLKRGPTRQDLPLPGALIPGGPYETPEQQAALRRLAEDIASNGVGPDGAYSAALQILLRAEPRLTGRTPGDSIDHEGLTLDELKEIVASLDQSHLFIQGPPGSGKTWSGARLIVDLIERGNRVGVTSNSHKAIHNLLAEIEQVAVDQGATFEGLKKASAGNPESFFDSEHDLIKSVTQNEKLIDPEVELTAGTAWHYCRDEVDGTLDYLFIDEAGQMSLADALALSTAARNVVLLGDPQQLPQVAQAAHPEDSSLSVLEHLLGDRQTIPPEEGVFLERTFRLHPDVCDFVSDLMYDERLRSAEGCELQSVTAPGDLTGTGLRWIPVEHEGNSQSSGEEAEAIAAAVAPLLDGARYTDASGDEHELQPSDILVVTPYNAQVHCLEERLANGIRIGTVDKFQGQEAQVVFFSMATSGGEEIPRNVEFLFSRNRLNVAISRARCLAILVASPRLLDLSAKSIDEMRLVNALCRFAETASVAA
jgi:predicted RecB family nuclease